MIWQKTYQLTVEIRGSEDKKEDVDAAFSSFESEVKKVKVRTNKGISIRVEDASILGNPTEDKERIQDFRESTKRLAGV